VWSGLEVTLNCAVEADGEDEMWSGLDLIHLYLFWRALCSFRIDSRGMARLGIGIAFRIDSTPRPPAVSVRTKTMLQS